MAAQQRRAALIALAVVLLVAMLLPSAQAWAPRAPRPVPFPLRMSSSPSPSPDAAAHERRAQPRGQQQRAQGLTDRRAALGQKLLGLSVASPLLLSAAVLGGRPLPARAADEAKKEAAIQVIRDGWQGGMEVVVTLWCGWSIDPS